jgi:hypothetical protein
MSNFLILFFGALAVLLVWGLVRRRQVKEDLDRDKQVAELNRQAAKGGRLRSGAEGR